MPDNQKIKQIRIGDNTYDVEPKNSEVLASSHITDALGYTPANSATTVTHTASTAVGSATKPIYVASNGAATACTYSLNTDVPSGAVFTDHITTVASSGTGNFVTGMTADANGKITYTKGTALTASDIANNVTTATSGKVLDAYQGKVLNDKIAAIEGRGRYLSIWDASTGKPNDLPGGGSSTTEVYTYKTGDYFIVKAAGNKVPSGTSIPAGTTIATFPSTDGGSSDINDTIYFNGTTWSVLHVPAGSGDVTGPASSVNNDLAAFDGTTGKVIKDSGISISTVDAKIENVNIGSIQGTVSSHISNFEAQAAGNLAVKDTVSASDLASDVTTLIDSKVSKSGDTMTGDLYINSEQVATREWVGGVPLTSASQLVVGQWYHLHVPAGTTSITSTDGYINCSDFNNINTSLTSQSIFANDKGFGTGNFGYGFVCQIEPYPPMTCYRLNNAASDFDCDFCYSSSTGIITNLLPFITFKGQGFAKDSEVVHKSGDTMTGNLTISKATPRLYLNGNDSGTDYPGIELQKNGTRKFSLSYASDSDITYMEFAGVSGILTVPKTPGQLATEAYIDNKLIPYVSYKNNFAVSTSNYYGKFFTSGKLVHEWDSISLIFIISDKNTLNGSHKTACYQVDYEAYGTNPPQLHIYRLFGPDNFDSFIYVTYVSTVFSTNSNYFELYYKSSYSGDDTNVLEILKYAKRETEAIDYAIYTGQLAAKSSITSLGVTKVFSGNLEYQSISKAEAVSKAGDTMTGQLVLNGGASFGNATFLHDVFGDNGGCLYNPNGVYYYRFPPASGTVSLGHLYRHHLAGTYSDGSNTFQFIGFSIVWPGAGAVTTVNDLIYLLQVGIRSSGCMVHSSATGYTSILYADSNSTIYSHSSASFPSIKSINFTDTVEQIF